MVTNGPKGGIDNDCPPAIKKINPWLKLAIGIITLVALISGGIWTMTSTFAMKPEVRAVETKVVKIKEEVKEDINLVAQNLLQTIQQDRVKSGIRFWQQQLESSHDKERELRNKLQSKPNDSYLKNQIQEEQRKQQQYQQKLNKLLEQ